MDKKIRIFICTNDKQLLGAKVSKFSIISRYPHLNESVDFIHLEKEPLLKDFEGKYLREGKFIEFDNSDLQSFTLLRFLPPSLMEYKGRALVIDPDVFLVKSQLDELLDLNLENFSIACRKGKNDSDWASSVMLLECSNLKHWCLEDFISDMKLGKLDYRTLMSLSNDTENILELEKKWNDFDQINKDTVFLHTTQRSTQPWKKGLKIDTYLKSVKPILGVFPRRFIHRILKKPLSDKYVGHPNKDVSNFFFSELSSAINEGYISLDEINSEISKRNIRQDIFSVLTLNEA